MVYPALLPLLRTPRLPVVDWTDALRRFKLTRPFRRKTKCGFCACAITFQLASNLCSSETKLCFSKGKAIMGVPIFYYTIQELLSRDGVVGVATGLWTRQVGHRVPAGSIVFSFRKRREWFWAPPSLLCSRYRGYFLWCHVTRAWGWPSLRIHGTILLLRGPG